jgi:hypothetical protein
MDYGWVLLIALAAVFTQSVSGFGSALLAMPLLCTLLTLRQAAPLMALIAGTLQLVLVFHYRRALRPGAVWRLCAASALAVPAGIVALRAVPEGMTLSVLAVVLLAYSASALADLRLPAMRGSGWAYGTGLIAGLLGGAYNTNGPPVIIYGACRRWPPIEFKMNLQVFFMFNTVLILTGHAVSGNFTIEVGRCYLAALPGIAAGVILGLSLDRFINPAAFRRIVLWLLVVLSVRLLVRAITGV